jgi:hypothetical protein
MPLYSIDVQIAATAYIKATTNEAARAAALALRNQCLELPNGDWGVEVCGRQFGDPLLPAISLSPAMTIMGPFDIDALDLA